MDDKVKRIYPEAKSGLINWMEENFHDIDSYVTIFNMKDGTTMTVHHCNDVVEAFGLLGLANATITQLANEGEFEGKGEKQ